MPTQTVKRRAEVLWRAGSYPFANAPLYSMSPAENRRAVESFKTCPLVLTHHGSPLDGKLGHVVELFPSAADFSVLGCEAEVSHWLDRAFRDDQGNPTPIPLSATWDRRTKTLKNVAMVVTPRIEEAIFEAAFAAGDLMDMPPAQPGTAPGVPAEGEQEPDPTAEGTVVISGEKADLIALKNMAERMGLVCELNEGQPEEEEQIQPQPGEEEEAPMSAETEARFAAQQKEIEELKKKLAARERADRQAHFSAEMERAGKEGKRFVDWLSRTVRIMPHQRQAVLDEYRQAAKDDLLHPTEVHFSADGKDAKGSRVEALEARFTSLPGQESLTREEIPDREESYASFDSAEFSAQSGKPSERYVASALEASSFSEVIRRERNNTNGKGGH